MKLCGYDKRITQDQAQNLGNCFNCDAKSCDKYIHGEMDDDDFGLDIKECWNCGTKDHGHLTECVDGHYRCDACIQKLYC